MDDAGPGEYGGFLAAPSGEETASLSALLFLRIEQEAMSLCLASWSRFIGSSIP